MISLLSLWQPILLASVIVFIFGPGVFSVDAILKKLFGSAGRKELAPATPAADASPQPQLRGVA